MERLTNQKKIILDYLKKVKCHPSAEKVYSSVRKKLPQISFGTVYRILDSFKRNGTILEIPCSCESHYDGDISPHAHFICQKCKKIFDIFRLCGSCNVLKNKKITIGKINHYQIYFYGQCKKCQNQKAKSSKSKK